MFSSIIVPVDLADISKGEAGLEIALKLADPGAVIKLVYVAEDLPLYLAAEIPTDVIEQSRHEAREKLAALALEANDKRVSYEILHGSPANGILAAAEKFTSDLVIIGSHKPDLSDYFLGSTASKVVRHAKCPVFVNR
jgi:universal stress protein F